MAWRPARLGLWASVLSVLLVAPPGAASHFQDYAETPEHDDLGRSDEPDWAVTYVLGFPIQNCVIAPRPLEPGCIPDFGLSPPLPGHTEVLAPGCTDDAGRQPSGLCWVHQASQGTLGVAGMTGSAAPGRITPTKGTLVRFLDLQTVTDAPTPAGGFRYLATNRKMDDLGSLQWIDPSFGGDYLGGPSGVFAWYGLWRDKNGNGVIDHLQAGTNTAPEEDFRNEWTWVGGCSTFEGTPSYATARAGLCYPEETTSFVVYVWPGAHHARCGGLLVGGVAAACPLAPADLPGRQAMCLANAFAGHPGHPVLYGGGPFPFLCPRDPGDLDADDTERHGDPLLGPRPTVAPDFLMSDRTGDTDIRGRLWVAGSGWAVWFWDAGLLAHTVMVGAVNAPPAYEDTRYDLRRASAVDVDLYTAWSPFLADLATTTVKPATRSAWTFTRDALVPLWSVPDGIVNGKVARDATLGPQRGLLDDLLADPGWSREPNTALDDFPLAYHHRHPPSTELPPGEQLHRGWLNERTAGRERAWLDAHAERIALFNTAPDAGVVACLVCATGTGATSSLQVTRPDGAQALDASDHRRALDPGLWVVTGHVGLWKDRGHAITESSLLAPSAYWVEPDGWVGNVVATTGTWRYRGYEDVACTIAGVSATRPYGVCNPYMDGQLQDPNDYASSWGEWEGQCPSYLGYARVAPSGVWTTPVFVWRSYQRNHLATVTEELVDYTGTSAVIGLKLFCSGSETHGTGAFASGDALLLPAGNLGVPVTTTVATSLSNPWVGRENVADVDMYESPGPPRIV